jgi:hypothetical protein
MIKMLTAYTFEIDDPDMAVQEILEQLDLEHGVLQNTVGLMFCSLDFINSGAAEAVGKALPFEVIGCTTMGIALPGAMGELLLAVSVLTSDDLCFRAGLSEPLDEDAEGRIARLYQGLAAPLTGPPSLILSFQPSLEITQGDFIVGVLDRISGGVPIFGSGALNEAVEHRSPRTIYNGAAYPNRLTLVLLSGGIAPRFAVNFIGGPQKKYGQKAHITAAADNRIISINDIPAAAYMENIGLMRDGLIQTLYAFPMAVDKLNGEPPGVCVILSVENDGSLVCGNSVSAGSILHISVPSAGEVLKTAADITGWVKARPDRDALFILSCFSRSIALVESRDEMNLIQRELKDVPIPYLFFYSGGEVCPINEAGGQRNRHHNYAIISCLL